MTVGRSVVAIPPEVACLPEYQEAQQAMMRLGNRLDQEGIYGHGSGWFGDLGTAMAAISSFGDACARCRKADPSNATIHLPMVVESNGQAHYVCDGVGFHLWRTYWRIADNRHPEMHALIHTRLFPIPGPAAVDEVRA